MRDGAAIFDAVIIGAGVAGSSAAIALARNGWSVALIERQRFPRSKVCGECIAASNLPLLHALGIGAAFDEQAGAPLQRVTLLRGHDAVSASLPAAANDRYPWGQALGRETLDSLLLDQAQAAGATLFQPWALRRLTGQPGQWRCELRAADSGADDRQDLHARLVIDAHGSWEDLPSHRPPRRQGRSAGELLAFKANFTGAALATGVIQVLALDGGYGGMVVADGGLTTVACCIRRDRLAAVRAAARGENAGEAVETWLRHGCAGVREALQGAERHGPWLAAGPLAPGIRVAASDTVFSIGNAAGEAHPILGEGMSMALQSAALLCTRLTSDGAGRSNVPDGARQAQIQRDYAAAWRRSFGPRLRLAAVFAHAAMRPGAAAAMMTLCRVWPGLLTQGARWGGKVRTVDAPGSAADHATGPRRTRSNTRHSTPLEPSESQPP